MEENIAILMSDLSGYTALTEAHGAVSAADLIDRYMEIVRECLVGDSHLQERTGDEVMIVSSSPDALLSTSVNIIKATSNEHNFLQVHGGLHYGKALKRGNSYFGSALNLTSRIAAKAGPGTYWCSHTFVDSLSGTAQVVPYSRGRHRFKNISGDMELYELEGIMNNSVYIDSICRMLILDTSRAIKHPTQEGLYFCSPTCLNIYLRGQHAHPEAS